jgi:DNA polymerase-1
MIWSTGDAPSRLATIPYEALCGKGAKQIGFDQVAIEQAAEYAAEDADLVPAPARPALSADRRRCRSGARLRDDRNAGARDPVRMERTGVLIDAQLLAQQSHEIGKRLLELEARAHAAAGQPFNVNSPKQLARSCSTSSACR